MEGGIYTWVAAIYCWPAVTRYGRSKKTKTPADVKKLITDVVAIRFPAMSDNLTVTFAFLGTGGWMLLAAIMPMMYWSALTEKEILSNLPVLGQ